jgi:phosphoglycolate phosphatase-like HAD superfamily hydrolase
MVMSVSKPVFNPRTSVLALDFDGVIADSEAECYVSGFNAFEAIENVRPRVMSLSELGLDRLREAKRMRPYIRFPEDYVFIAQAVDSGATIRDQSDFDAFRHERESLASDYAARFDAERKQMLRENPECWLALNTLYPGIREFLIGYEPKDRLFIVTTKPLEYVEAILKDQGIDLPSANRLRSNRVRTKAIIIREMADKLAVAPNDIHMIDDQVDHLIPIIPTGARLYLAAWGYNTEIQRKLAREKGIAVLGIKEAMELFGK